jgi:hypothetical protein
LIVFLTVGATDLVAAVDLAIGREEAVHHMRTTHSVDRIGDDVKRLSRGNERELWDTDWFYPLRAVFYRALRAVWMKTIFLCALGLIDGKGRRRMSMMK